LRRRHHRSAREQLVEQLIVDVMERPAELTTPTPVAISAATS